MFSYKMNGKEYFLQYSDRFVVVRTKSNKALEPSLKKKSSKTILPFLEPYDSHPHKGVFVFKVKEREPTGLSMRDAARKSFSSEASVRYAGRALEDPKTGKPVIYTENIIVKFKETVSREKAESLLTAKNLIVSSIKGKEHFTKILQNVVVAKIPEGSGAKVLFDTVKGISKLSSVQYVYPELIVKRKFKSAHPLQWHLAATVIRGVAVNAHISIDVAWRKSVGKNVVVAIIDDGIDINHPEFKGRFVFPYDAARRSHDPNPKRKIDNHGTSVAGVAVAAGIKAPGVAPGATLMPIRLASNLGSIEEVEAFAWALSNGADIISCSWGPEDGAWDDQISDGDEFPLPDLTRDIIKEAVTNGRQGKGIPVLFAAGNGNESADFDSYASNPDVIAVAACNDTNKRSVYSDYGKSVFCCFPSDDFGHQPFNHPAPITSGIHTTDRLGDKGYSSRNYTNDFGGTSSATPGVAGVIALMIAANPGLALKDIRLILQNTCDKIDSSGGRYDSKGHSIFYDYGKVNASKAVNAAIAYSRIKNRGTKKRKS